VITREKTKTPARALRRDVLERQLDNSISREKTKTPARALRRLKLLGLRPGTKRARENKNARKGIATQAFPLFFAHNLLGERKQKRPQGHCDYNEDVDSLPAPESSERKQKRPQGHCDAIDIPGKVVIVFLRENKNARKGIATKSLTYANWCHII